MEVCTIGGYGEVGKNMTAVKIGSEVVILDMGFYMQKLVSFEEEGGSKEFAKAADLIRIGAIPDDSVIKNWRDEVKAIVLSHSHLDHYGAVPYLAPNYDAPIIGSPLTIEVLRKTLKDDNLRIKNKLVSIHPNSSYKASESISIELLNITHSVPQTTMIVIHTPEGVIMYANDFKFDKHPIIGHGPNYERLKEIKNVRVLVVDSIYANDERKTPSEMVAREMLKDVLLGTENKGNIIVVTCFASHLARLKSIIEFGKKLNRKIVFLGRSLSKYVNAAERTKIIKFSNEVEIVAYGNKIKKKLEEIDQNRSKYLVVLTGGQGEPGSVLMKILNGVFPFKFMPNDHMIFSNKTIPIEPNLSNRKKIEDKLRENKVRIFTDIHVSGHCAREDLRDLIALTTPEHIIPAHGEFRMMEALRELATEMGYKENKNVHLLKDGDKLMI